MAFVRAVRNQRPSLPQVITLRPTESIERDTASLFLSFFFRSGVTNTPRGGVVNCAQVKFLGIPFRSQRTISAHPSPLGMSVPTPPTLGTYPSPLGIGVLTPSYPRYLTLLP